MHLQAIDVDTPSRLDQEADQRQCPRRETFHPAVLHVLGTNIEVFHGEIRNISKGGTQVWLDQQLSCGTLVGIDYNDNRLLGEVVYCAQGQAGWLVGIRVEHALFGLKALASNWRTLLVSTAAAHELQKHSNTRFR